MSDLFQYSNGYKAGYDYFHDNYHNASPDANPYDVNTHPDEHADWMEGYNAAEYDL